jgi:hypothetical protein
MRMQYRAVVSTYYKSAPREAARSTLIEERTTQKEKPEQGRGMRPMMLEHPPLLNPDPTTESGKQPREDTLHDE